LVSFASFEVVIGLLIAVIGLHRFLVFFRSPSMGNKLYVGNLPYSFRDDDLQQAFSQFGAVSSAKVMMERDTGRSKGFGFVEMGNDAEAQAAISGLNGQSYGGRGLVVNEARPMEARPPRSGGGGFGGGGGGGGYGGGGGGGRSGGGGGYGGGRSSY
jgi:cold-inducible RNA-binding protein